MRSTVNYRLAWQRTGLHEAFVPVTWVHKCKGKVYSDIPEDEKYKAYVNK